MVGTYPALTETFVLREISAMRRRGVEVVIGAVRRPVVKERAATNLVSDATCVYARPDSVASHCLANLVSVLRRPRRYFGGAKLFLREAMVLPPKDALQLLYHFFAGVGFCPYLRRLGVGHLHCHFTSGANMALAASIVHDFPFSFTAHASADLFVRPVLIEEKLARAAFVVPVCDYSRRYLDSISGFRHSQKLHRIYNGIDSSELSRARQSAGRLDDRSSSTPGRLIVSVGSLVAAKGHATLVQVCARLRARGREFHCRIIGEGPERATLERLIRGHELEDRVELVGARPLDAVYAELLKADVFVLLSEIGRSGYRDGFPTAILEAMVAKLPVLATSLSGIPEMVLDGVTGLLVGERDVEAASRALECLLESAQLRRSMGEQGHRRVHELFDLDRSADELAGLLTASRSLEASPLLAELASQ
jgi:colanic acid/amylovoran biosynthesis glycosyltransferase